MKRRLNILSILVFIVLGLSLYTTGYQFGTGMKAGMSLAKEQHKESKACDRPMLAGDFRFVDVVPTIAMIKPDTIINAQNNEKVPVMYTQTTRFLSQSAAALYPSDTFSASLPLMIIYSYCFAVHGYLDWSACLHWDRYYLYQ